MPVNDDSIVTNCDFNLNCEGAAGYHHTAIDYSPSAGDSIKAVASGKVVLIQINGSNDHGLGNCIIIEHELLNGSFKYSLYAHLDNIATGINVNTYVSKGGFLGEMGGTGNGATNAWAKHLHFEIKDSPVLHNPTWTTGQAIYWGYTPDIAENYGYDNPHDYFGLVQIINPDCATYEPNNTQSQATQLYAFGRDFSWSDSLSECINQTSADEDWYRINLTHQGELTITLSSQNISSLFIDWLDNGNVTSSTTENGNKQIVICSNNGPACYDTAFKIYTNQSTNNLIPYTLDIQWAANQSCNSGTSGRQSSDNNTNQNNSTITISGNTNVCEGLSNTLSITGGSGTFDWLIDGQSVHIGNTFNTQSLNTGLSDLFVIDTNDVCSFVGTQLNITSDVTANAGSNVTIQDGNSTQLQGSGGISYSWSPSTDLSNPNISNPIASPAQTTTYTLTTTENGCTDTDQVTITVVQGSTVDLIIDNIWTVPANPEVGEDVDLYVQVKNVGTETAYSISWDYIINTNTIGSDNHYILEPNETRTEYFNNYNFSSSGNFDYCINIEVEPNEQITNNNNYCEQITIGNSIPEDLVVTNISVSLSSLNAGDNLTVSADQYYSGGRTVSELPDIDLGYYLSSDCNFSSDDIFLAEDDSSIGSDDIFDNETEVVTIPSYIESGNYFIIFVADHNNHINESNENNNTLCNNIVINNPNSQTIEAGIVNPVNNLIIHEDNRSSYFPSGDWGDMQVDGWSNTGNVSSIRLYYRSVSSNQTSFSLRNVSDPNSGSWAREIGVTGGVYEVYVNVRCNYNNCLQAGTDSEIRRFTYVKPYRAGNFYIPNSTNDDVNIVITPNYGSSALYTGFYYRVYRNTTASLSGGTYLGNWSQEEEFIDTNAEPNQTYYYWVDVAMNSNGSYNSGIIESEYRLVTTQTLGLNSEEVSDSIRIFPNPVKENLSISYNNSITIKEISIFDLNGRLINKIENDFNTIKTNALSKGVYMLSIKTNKGVILRKIIKI